MATITFDPTNPATDHLFGAIQTAMACFVERTGIPVPVNGLDWEVFEAITILADEQAGAHD